MDHERTVLTFDVYKVWPRVQHLFYKADGKSEDGVTVSSEGFASSFIEVECSTEYAKLIEPMLTSQIIQYSRRRP